MLSSNYLPFSKEVMIADPITTIARIGPSCGQFIISAPNALPRYPEIIAIMEEIAAFLIYSYSLVTCLLYTSDAADEL